MLKKKISNYLAALMLLMMFVLMFVSSWNDSAIMDELPHIPAGYSYLTHQDYRLNPEHPPLIKDLAALPLLFLDITFPSDSKYWLDEVNGQWAFGAQFLYEYGNDADKILRFARLPVMALTILLGWLLFSWARRRYGDRVGLFALFFFATSPTFIAHGRYVTTDIAAAFGFFIGIVAFIRFLEHDALNVQPMKYLAIAGLVFGAAQLLKFSLFLLVPLYFLLGIIWVFLSEYENLKELPVFGERIKHLLKKEAAMVGKIILIGIIGVTVIWAFYIYHVWNYPSAKQMTDAEFLLSSFGFKPLADLDLWMISNKILRPLGEYFLGLLMVVQRAAGGNTTYFLGEVNNSGWWYYFPVAYLLKEQLAFHILTVLALLLGIGYIFGSREKSFTAAVEWMRDNFVLTASVLFIAVYWTQSMRSNLNIGVRHILPTFPFIYLLVARELVKWTQTFSVSDPQDLSEWIRSIYEKYLLSAPKYLIVGVLAVWIVFEVVLGFPHYLSYYNELGGGPMRGYAYIVDSNYDWGQDLKRLTTLVEDEGIDKIKLDYFGGGSPRYYLGDKFEPWQSSVGAPAKGEWFALSVTFLQQAWFSSEIEPRNSYSWLRDKEPSLRAGSSIFLYQF